MKGLSRMAGTAVYMFRMQLSFRIACVFLVCIIAVTFLGVRSSMAYARIDQIEQRLNNCAAVQVGK